MHYAISKQEEKEKLLEKELMNNRGRSELKGLRRLVPPRFSAACAELEQVFVFAIRLQLDVQLISMLG
ncbi:unnamed protein product [Cylicocyclus nassatus]|uniref:Uncharacterized protein n=1 Tax=Cylicocyclus nassatus TaxID=53992 RepID=A0AA36H042_CYLNA|nr:unnamed protein product [Cylicocyclus nassatus]